MPDLSHLKPVFLYHATTKTWEGNLILPFASVGRVDAHVFAAEDLQTAYAYALKTPDMNLYMNADGMRVVGFAHITDYSEMKARHPVGWIHKVNAASFVQLYPDDVRADEWVSTDPVAFDSQESIRLNSIDDVMARGIQIFASAQKLTWKDWHQARIMVQGQDYQQQKLWGDEVALVTLKMYKVLMDEGKWAHLNAQAGIGTADIDRAMADLQDKIKSYARAPKPPQPSMP